MNVLFVGLGGFLGAIARYFVALYFPTTDGGFPLSTFIVNAVGCLIMAGCLIFFDLTEFQKLFLVTGFLGALTTFSTFSADNYKLIQQGQVNIAIINIVVSMVFSLAVFFILAGLNKSLKG